jgi:negative regulator of flagellin synthesis FlgM
MMPDPIQGVNQIGALKVASTNGPGAAPEAGTTQPSGAAPSVDSADVARAEALLATITKAAAAVPPIDPARVSELKQAINSGIYEANPQQIAEKMIEIEALLTSRSGNG